MADAGMWESGPGPKKFTVGDATLAVRSFGQGPDLLLVHGFPLHGYTWRKVLPVLAQRFTCHAVDLAGLGESDWSAATNFDFHGHAARLAALADAMGLQRYSVMAQDTGATVARCLGLRDPQRMQKLIMINTEIPGHRPPWIVEYQFLMKLPGSALFFQQVLLRSRLFLRSPMGFGGCFHDLDLIDGDFHAHFVRPYIESSRRMDGLKRYLVGLHWDTVDSLAVRHGELKMPVLLIWGEDDPTFPVERARGMVRQLPNCAGLVAIPGAKLLVHEERPDEVAREALSFLSS